MQVSVVIPVYKMLNKFVKNLQHNMPFLRDCEIIIVNDNPLSHLPEDLPSLDLTARSITWINNKDNLGFSRSVNVGVRKASEEYILLLNSDVKLIDDSWAMALPAFAENPELFGVGFAQKEKDGRMVGRNELYFKDGLFHHKGLPSELEIARPVSGGNWKLELQSTAFAEGGSSLIRKSMWDKLGGFDEAYSPFYWEDVDLSYRAKLRGWHIRFASSIIVVHHHETDIGAEYSRSQINATAFRNQLYFTNKFAQGMQRVEYLFFRYIRLPLQKMKGG